MISSFYENTIADSNVVDCSTFLSNLFLNHPNLDKTELNKDIREIDWKRVTDSLEASAITSKWEVPEAKGGAKGKSTSIQSFKLKSGDVLGIGCKVSSDCLLIKGLKSFFPQHSFKFGDDEQKAMLKKPLEELLLMKQNDNLTYSEFKKLMTFQITFQLYSPDRLVQSEEAIQQMKCLMLIKEIIGKQVKEDPSIKSLPQYKTNGFIQEKYNNFSKEDITQLTVNVEIVPKFTDGLRQEAVFVVTSNSEGFNYDTVIDQSKSIEYIMNQVQMKTLDLVVYLDNCSTKKQGKEVAILPKLQAVNVIITKDKEDAKPKGHGLNLQKFNEIIKKTQ